MLRDTPLVTVVTLTYQNFEHLFQTIESVFKQDYQSIEYYISDDASKEFPREAIEGYIDANCPPNVSCYIVEHESNLGTVKNLNSAYKVAKGEYFINLSCGDVFFNERVVSKLVDRFLSTGCDVLVATRILYRGDFEPICLLPHYEEREIIDSYHTGIDQYKGFITSRFYDMASGSAMYYSKKILQKRGYFDERYTLWEDGPFIAKYLQIGRIECAYDIVSIWYEHGGVSSTELGLGVQSYDLPEKLLVDAELFNKHEKMERMDLFTHKERRLIRYRNLRFELRNSPMRYLLYIVYFPELLSCLCYSKKRRARIAGDQIEIGRLLEKKARS